MGYERNVKSGHLIRMPRMPLLDADDRMFVYAIKSGEFTKVGISRDVAMRFKQIHDLNPHEPQLVMYRTIKRNLVFAVEKRMHQLLSEWHFRGEWFTAPITAIREAARVAIYESWRIERIERQMRDQNTAIIQEARRRAMERGPCRSEDIQREYKRVRSEVRRSEKADSPSHDRR